MSTAPAAPTGSTWAPLSQPLFRTLWLATLVSNIGSWMHDVGASWLMTTLTSSAATVALVQTATSLPYFFLALPAGALSDIVDRRRYLLGLQAVLALVAATLGLITLTGNTTPAVLLSLTFAMGIGSAMMMPAWAAVTPEIVPRSSLRSALALNSLGINIARAIGPAIAGVIVATVGSGAVFALNAVSFLGVIAVLWRWRRARRTSELPTERFVGAMRAGVRFARHSHELHAALIRGFGFFLFASALWALLPLVARAVPGAGAGTFGLLMGSIGAGAVIGAMLLPRVRTKLGTDALVGVATVVYAAAMAIASVGSWVPLLAGAMVLAGAGWISVLTSINAAAQLALPDWVRSRGLAVFIMVFMGTMALGSVVWGRVAETGSIHLALQIAAGGALVSLALLRRWRLEIAEGVDFTASNHWEAPIVHAGVTHDRGPVLVTIEYALRPGQRDAFRTTVGLLGRSRRRDGAYGWGLFEDTTHQDRVLECFYVESWLEHLRQHERVSDAERLLQEQIEALLVERPLVRHFVADEPRDA